MRRAGNRTGGWRRLAVGVVMLACPALGFAQVQAVHGENSVFAGQGVAIAWAVLKGAEEERTQVVIRIVPAGERYAYVMIEGVDPFTHKRQVILEGSPLREGLEVRSPRGTFADLPRREIHLYRTARDWQARQPSVTVYYLGIPDTTPEFTSDGPLLTYLAEALAKAGGAAHGPRP